MELVKFNKHYRCYNVGEVAGFEEHFARGLIESGIASRVIDTPTIVKDVPVAIEGSDAGVANEIEDEDLDGPVKGRGKAKKS